MPRKPTTVQEWRKAGMHLPPALRDFHDQKDVFKCIGEMQKPASHREGVDPVMDALPGHWIAGHVYAIDFFLWFMARHGYTLQRSRARLPFDDLNKTVQARREREFATSPLRQLFKSREVPA